MAAGRRLIFAKGRDSHDYKYSSAALEDFYNTTPAWRNRFLAASMFNLHGSGDQDSPVLARTRVALVLDAYNCVPFSRCPKDCTLGADVSDCEILRTAAKRRAESQGLTKRCLLMGVKSYNRCLLCILLCLVP